ncbi:hypothetical protein BDR26DRAFT_944710 [Obelidium mucronatum]|nr:hypothetical protein BDR26DRAFT_944710 [Obelidium mucronatum]
MTEQKTIFVRYQECIEEELKALSPSEFELCLTEPLILHTWMEQLLPDFLSAAGRAISKSPDGFWKQCWTPKNYEEDRPTMIQNPSTKPIDRKDHSSRHGIQWYKSVRLPGIFYPGMSAYVTSADAALSNIGRHILVYPLLEVSKSILVDDSVKLSLFQYFKAYANAVINSLDQSGKLNQVGLKKKEIKMANVLQVFHDLNYSTMVHIDDDHQYNSHSYGIAYQTMFDTHPMLHGFFFLIPEFGVYFHMHHNMYWARNTSLSIPPQFTPWPKFLAINISVLLVYNLSWKERLPLERVAASKNTKGHLSECALNVLIGEFANLKVRRAEDDVDDGRVCKKYISLHVYKF